MGSCVSRGGAPAGSMDTAKVVDIDGSMAQFAAPVTASEALEATASSSWSPIFLCSSDELRFDAPPRALAADEALQPGWLYFSLPLPMLRRPLSGQEMAALAVKATSALASGDGGTRRRKAGRVAPLVVDVASGSNEGEREREGGWDYRHAYGKYGVRHGGGETVGKARKSQRAVGYRSRSARRRAAAGAQRLGAIILEASDSDWE